MGASKTRKVIKYTYAERASLLRPFATPRTPPLIFFPGVLGSFSAIQREHKKHAIHLASLRAQSTSSRHPFARSFSYSIVGAPQSRKPRTRARTSSAPIGRTGSARLSTALCVASMRCRCHFFLMTSSFFFQEEDGILASSEPVGTVVLTPSGKKACVVSFMSRRLALRLLSMQDRRRAPHARAPDQRPSVV